MFKDTETLWLCDAIMEYGVLIGAFFSAWFLHLTLQPLDLMIHQKQYGVSHYVRQMDNFTIFGSNKRKLRKLLEDIKKWLAEIGMKIKGNWQIFPRRVYAQGRKSASGFAEEKAATPPPALTLGSWIPIRTRLHDLAKAQSIPAQAIASSLLLPARQEPRHLVQEGFGADLTARTTSQSTHSRFWTGITSPRRCLH